MDDDFLETRQLTLDLPERGEMTFLLVASVPSDTDWEDVLGVLYELGGDFSGDLTEIQTADYPRLVLQPTEEGLFAVAEREGTLEIYLAQD